MNQARNVFPSLPESLHRAATFFFLFGGIGFQSFSYGIITYNRWPGFWVKRIVRHDRVGKGAIYESSWVELFAQTMLLVVDICTAIVYI